MAEDKKMLKLLYDGLFDDAGTFIKYMAQHDSAEVRKRMLKTDTLRMWYCFYVCLREEVFAKISDEEWVKTLAYKNIRERIQQRKLAAATIAVRSPYLTGVSTNSIGGYVYTDITCVSKTGGYLISKNALSAWGLDDKSDKYRKG